MVKYLGWKTTAPGSQALKELTQFLLDRAMEHDSPTLLFNLARKYLMSAHVVRPGPTVLAKMVGEARTGATALTTELLGHLLTEEARADLERLLGVDMGLGMTRLEWLRQGARETTASAVKTSIDKLLWLRAIDAQAAIDQLDEVVALFDQAVSARESRAKTKTDEALVERAKKGEARQLLMDLILPVLADPAIADEQVGGMLREQIGMQRLREITSDAWNPLPKDHGRLSELDSSYSYLRQFTPNVLAAVDFQGGPGTDELMTAVGISKRLNETGGRKVPADAPTGFVPARYADYLDKARKSGEDTAFRHYWELVVILCLRDGLRSGDVFVPGSRRYADPSTYLYTAEQWEPKRAEYAQLVRKPLNGKDAVEVGKTELHAALADLEDTLRNAPPDQAGAIRLDGDGNLIVPPLSAENIPTEVKQLHDDLAGMPPFAPIASVLIELDARTGFVDCFTHAGGRKLAKSAETKRNILACLIGLGTDLGLVRMSEACGVSYEVLAWTMEWYIREETLRDANTVIVNHHHALELSKVFGGGTMSSSDGQRFPVRGKSLTSRNMTIHGGQVLSSYTHVSDQWSTFGTQQFVPTTREGQYTLDEFLGNKTDLPLHDHAADTHGATLINFSLFDLVGKRLTPRMRDLTKVTLVRDDTPTVMNLQYPNAGPLLNARWGEALVEDTWDDLMRMGASLKYGQATASLVVGKWSAAPHQNTLATALKEWGLLRRTLHTARYLSDPVYRRRISRQLNKDESLHALRRDLHYAQQGTITARPYLSDQTEQAWCLTILTNSVVVWTTAYFGLAVQRLRADGRTVEDELLAHISPGRSENMDFFGAIPVEVESELAKLDNGWRPLRTRPADGGGWSGGVFGE